MGNSKHVQVVLLVIPVNLSGVQRYTVRPEHDEQAYIDTREKCEHIYYYKMF